MRDSRQYQLIQSFSTLCGAQLDMDRFMVYGSIYGLLHVRAQVSQRAPIEY